MDTAYTSGGRPYKVTVFVGSYRLFFRQMMNGELDLHPHPRLAPPVISAKYAQLATTDTTDLTDITEIPTGTLWVAHRCGECGSKLELVRPGKYQCPKC